MESKAAVFLLVRSCLSPRLADLGFVAVLPSYRRLKWNSGDVFLGVCFGFGAESLGGGNSDVFLMLNPKIGEDVFPILTIMFFFRWVGEKPPTRKF